MNKLRIIILSKSFNELENIKYKFIYINYQKQIIFYVLRNSCAILKYCNISRNNIKLKNR